VARPPSAYELAKGLAQHGYDVAISASSDRVPRSAERLGEFGAQAWTHQADAGTHDGVEAFWRVVERVGRPVSRHRAQRRHRHRRRLRRHPLEDHVTVLAVNVIGATRTAKRVVDHIVPVP
jgi:uncharacterized protein